MAPLPTNRTTANTRDEHVADHNEAHGGHNLNETHRGLTTTAHGGIVAAIDPRLTDARTPLGHRGTHGVGGSDALTAADLGGGVADATTFLRGDRAWAVPAPGGGGAMELIARVVLGATAASIDFTSIPATYESLVIDFLGRGDAAVAAVECRARFNNDATAIYDHLGTSSAGNGGGAGTTGARFGVIPAATGTANKPGVVRLVLPGYARTVFHKVFTAHGGDMRTTPQTELATGVWGSTAAVNAVTLYPFSGNLIAGTVATLYGIKGA